MSFSSWLRSRNHSAPAARRRNQQAGFRPRTEALEDRLLLSASAAAYTQTNLVGYKAGIAQATDTNLNGWGMASLPDGTFVVANAFTTGVATFYTASGHVLPADDHGARVRRRGRRPSGWGRAGTPPAWSTTQPRTS